METLIGKPTPKNEEQMTEEEYKKRLAEPDTRPEFMKFMDNPLSDYSTDELKALLERIKIFVAERKKHPLPLPKTEIATDFDLLDAREAHYQVAWEVLRRENPQAKAVDDKWQEIQDRKGKEYNAWKEHVIATEGRDAVGEKLIRGEYLPLYTPEESDVFIEHVKHELAGGVPGLISLEVAEGAKKAGGLERYFRELTKESYRKVLTEIHASNDPDKDRQLQNIRDGIAMRGMNEAEIMETSAGRT